MSKNEKGHFRMKEGDPEVGACRGGSESEGGEIGRAHV